MSRIKVGINGFGRIGRAFTRIALERDTFDIVLINTRKTPTDLMAYLLRRDSVYGTYSKPVSHDDRGLVIGDKHVTCVQFAEADAIPWDEHGVDIVVDCTGAFLTGEALSHHFHMGETHENHQGIYVTREQLESAHIRGTVKKVLLSAPAKDDAIPTVVLGVNDTDELLRSSAIISNASCTTNCAAPLFKVLHDSFGIVMGQMTTIHAYTMTQSMMDDANKEHERSRSAVLNVVPSTSGAAKAVVKVIPDLKGKIDVFAVRVPVPTGSSSDLSVVLSRPVTVDEIHAAYRAAADGAMKGILRYAGEDVLVTQDIVGDSHSVIYDPLYTRVTSSTLVKVYGWYDNEWGYSCRLVDLAEKVGKTF